MLRFQINIYLLILIFYLTFSHNNHMNPINIGSSIPEFSLPDQNGNLFDIKAVVGKKNLVIYFYPKDDTPGCTLQACGLRDAWGELSAHANIFGVSVDSAASHEKFIKKYQLPFPLLSDADKKIVNSYGVWVEKTMYGKNYMGAELSTFVIDGAVRPQQSRRDEDAHRSDERTNTDQDLAHHWHSAPPSAAT